MGNCLVTKLKGVVDNPNLLKLGEIRIKFRRAFNNEDIIIGPNTVSAKLNGATEITRDIGGMGKLTCNANDYISILPKYDLKDVDLNGEVIGDFTGADLLNVQLWNNELTNDDLIKLAKATRIDKLACNAGPNGLNLDILSETPIKTIHVGGMNTYSLNLEKFASNTTLCQYIDMYNLRVLNSWDPQSRPSSAPIISVYGTGELENNGPAWEKDAIRGFLQNMSNCQPVIGDEGVKTKICVETLDKTSVDNIEDYVTALKAKGYQVYINGIAL